MTAFSTTRRNMLPAALALLLAQGCSQVHIRGSASSAAPPLGEKGQAHIRGVSDPNAEFTLIDRTHASAQQASFHGNEQDAASLPLCQPSALQVYEAAASMSGQERSLRLAIKNNSEAACHLPASPSISLEDSSGASIAGIAIRQTGASTLTGTVTPPMHEVAPTSAGPAAASQIQTVDIVLPPSGEASFEIGWSSGESCPVVSSIAVGIPTGVVLGSLARDLPTPAFEVNHPLRVCNGEVRVTSLLSGSSV